MLNRNTMMVSVAHVTHLYGKTRALDEVTVDIPSGRMVGLLGPDGVGKSTLLGLIAGARKIQAGTIQVLGGDMADVRHRTAVGPRIAYMPQGLGKNLYADLSVFENLDFFGSCSRSLRLNAGRASPHSCRPPGSIRFPIGRRASSRAA